MHEFDAMVSNIIVCSRENG